MPMMIRAVSRNANEPARPDTAEHRENTMIESSTKGLRARNASLQALTK